MNLTSTREGSEEWERVVEGEGVKVTEEDWEERSSSVSKEAGVVT